MPETPEAIRGLADTMITRFTPPTFVPGCEVKSIADISEYAADNGWLEAIVGGDNQQRVRYYGTPQGVAVNDFVDVEYFPAYKLYRVFGATLGGTAIAGGLRVDKVWDSDFGDIAFQAGTTNLTVNGTRTLTIPTDLIHAGDADNKIGFTDDAQTFTVGGEVLLTLTEAAQDVVKIGDGGDVNINFNDQMFFNSANLRFGIGLGAASGSETLTVRGDAVSNPFGMENDNGNVIMSVTFGGDRDGVLFLFDDGGTANVRLDASGANYLNGGDLAIGHTSPSTRLDIGAGAIEGEEMTAPGAGASNTYRLYAEDNGAGKTRLMVIFSTGAAQQLAIQP